MLKLQLCILSAMLLTPALLAQSPAPANPDSSTFGPDGTAHITREVPMPSTVSPEAQQWLKQIEHESPQPHDLAEQRKRTDDWRKFDSAEALKKFPVKIRTHRGQG